MISAALSKFPSAISLIKSGISISTGHPSVHGLFLHWRQRLASSIAISG